MNRLQRDEEGNLIMNEHNIMIYCNQDRLSDYPELNKKLYLHFKGFKKIGGLDNFINIRVLWLENNFINKIENLGKLVQLTHLFLQNNLIEKIENLDNNIDLHTINLSSNFISKIENMGHLKQLSTLELQSNQIKSVHNITELSKNTSINTLNLSNNSLVYESDNDLLLQTLAPITELKCLYLMNNEYIRSVVNYRKSYIASLENLTYFDNQPVFINERRLANAWGKGGKEGEAAEKQLIYQEAQDKKNEARAIVRSQLPKNLENKIIFFERSIRQIEEEIEELKIIRAKQLNEGFSISQIEYVDSSIDAKQKSADELIVMVKSMKERIYPNTTIQPNVQIEKIQTQQSTLDEID